MKKKYIPLTETETGRVHDLINEKLQTLFKSGDSAQGTYDQCEELLALRAKFKVKK